MAEGDVYDDLGVVWLCGFCFDTNYLWNISGAQYGGMTHLLFHLPPNFLK